MFNHVSLNTNWLCSFKLSSTFHAFCNSSRNYLKVFVCLCVSKVFNNNLFFSAFEFMRTVSTFVCSSPRVYHNDNKNNYYLKLFMVPTKVFSYEEQRHSSLLLCIPPFLWVPVRHLGKSNLHQTLHFL